MSTIKRKPRLQRAGRITPEAVAAYQHGDKIALHAALRLPPWQLSPLDAVGACPYPPRAAGATTWPDSVSLRAELEAVT